MANIYVKSGSGSIGSGSYRGNWTASQTYALGDRVCGVATSDYWVFECTTAGTAGAVEPTWNKTDGIITTDDTVTWTARIPDTWADATLTLAKAAANDAAGDTIYVSQNHAESSGSTQTAALAGTAASPVRVICGNTGAEPPTAAATTATVTTTGTNAITFSGCGYYYGITFNCGSSTSLAIFGVATPSDGSYSVWDSCVFNCGSSSASQRFQLGYPGAGGDFYAKLLNCTFKFNNTSQSIKPEQARVEIIGGGFSSTSAAVTRFMRDAVATSIDMLVKDFDFTYAAQAIDLVTAGPATGQIKFVNCKLPSSWSGNLVSGTLTNPGFRVSMYNCDSGSTNYRLWIETSAGSIKSETTLVKTGGASDGTTALSWKLTTTANANEYVAPLITDDMAIWIENIGQPNVISVDILHDSTTPLTDADVWLEIDYLGSSSFPLGTPSSDKRATVLTTPTNQNSSAAQWVSTGMTNPNKQKLEVTFTPQMKGFVYARVCLAKPSYTVYVDPKPTVI